MAAEGESAVDGGTSAGAGRPVAGAARIAIGAAALLGALLCAAPAGAAVGDLSYAGCITGETESGSGGSAACAEIAAHASGGKDSGLSSPSAAASSPDGENVYVASESDDAIATFDRDPLSGELTFSGCLTGETESGPDGSGACSKISSAAASGADSGLDLPTAVLVSPDGKNVYVASKRDDAVASFERDPADGALTYAGCITGETESGSGGTGACGEIAAHSAAGADSGLDGPVDLAISPGGEDLYAAVESDDAVAGFARDPSNGALTHFGCITGETESGPSGTDACFEIPKHASGGADSGLDHAAGVAISPAGDSVYLIGQLDDAVAGFDRAAGSGALSYGGCLTGETQSGPSGSGACMEIETATSFGALSGLDSPAALGISPDSENLYLAGEKDDSVATFDRDPFGVLTYAGCLSGDTDVACTAIAGATQFGRSSGLNAPAAIAVSADGSNLYAGSPSDDALVDFERAGGTGALTYGGCVTGAAESGAAGSGACAEIPSVSSDGDDSGLDSALAVVAPGDGRSLHVLAGGDDAIATFEVSQCSDGVDNDADGKTDHPDDPGCSSSSDDDETDPDAGSSGSGGDGGSSAGGGPDGTGAVEGGEPAGDGSGATGGPGSGPDTDPPAIRLAGKKKQSNKRKLTVKATCDEDCDVTVGPKGRATIKSRAPVGAAGKRRAKLKLRTAKASLRAEETARLTLRFKGRRTKRLVKRAIRTKKGKITLKLRGSATDAAGNSAGDTFKVKIK